MNHIKVVNEPSELAPMLIAVQTDIRRKVFEEVTREWRTIRELQRKFGKKGKDAILLFEKMKLVESRWQSTPETPQPEKSYHTYYTSFHINASCPVNEMCDVLAAAALSEKQFDRIEQKILRLVGKEGKFTGDIADKLNISPTFLKSVVKRSVKLECRGHRIERIRD